MTIDIDKDKFITGLQIFDARENVFLFSELENAKHFQCF